MSLWFDLKYAWRLLRKSWGNSLLCASVVALSVGLAVWTCSMTYSQLLKPLGFPGSERWYSVQISSKGTTIPRPVVDAYTYQELLAQNRSADHLGAFAHRSVVLSEGEASTRLRGVEMTPRLLAATRVAPLLGRTLDDADGQLGASAVAVLSYDTWQRYFAGDRGIVGKTTRIDSEPVQVVGVMPREFFAFEDFEVWMPLRLARIARPGGDQPAVMLSPLIALGANQSVGSVLNEMTSVVERVNREHPDLFNAKRRVALIPALRMYTHSQASFVVMMGLMSASVLLLACVNVSMVFLARLLERSRELALRTALGASRSRLMRQCLVDTALIVLLGLVAGFGLAAMGVRWAGGVADFATQTLASGRIPNLMVLRPAEVAAAVLAATAIWLLSTLIPAWRVARLDPAAVLAGSGKGAAVRSSSKTVGVLVGLQVVISCVVLVLCGNLVLAVNHEVSKPSGIESGRITISTHPTAFGSRLANESERLQYWDDLASAIRSRIPAAGVAFATAAPTRPGSVAAAIEGREGTANEGTLTLRLTVVSESYFDLLGLKLRSGRVFDGTDNGTSVSVAVVDERMAARYWPDQDVLGKRIQLNPADGGPWLTIVGVVSAVSGGPYSRGAGVIYRPLRQAVPSEFRLLVRTPNASSDVRSAIQAAAFAVDRDLPMQNLQMLDDYLAALDLSYTTMRPVLVVVALITALLAASGLFGLISRSVAQRTQEVGIRRALGATPWRATSMFMRQGAVYLSVAVVGIGVGILAMTGLSADIPNIFEHVVVATIGVVLLMSGVIFSASYLPSRRSVALEPGDALRHE